MPASAAIATRRARASKGPGAVAASPPSRRTSITAIAPAKKVSETMWPIFAATPGIRCQDCGVGAHGWPTSARNRVPKGGSEKRTTAEKREYIRHCRPRGVSIAEGCRLMGIGRSAFYDTPEARARDLSVVAEMNDEFEAYSYRRVDAELRHRGIVMNAKKIPPAHARACAESKAAQAFNRDDG